MSEMRMLYQEVILDHNRKPRCYGKLDHANHQALGHNPLCGDSISLSLRIVDEKIEALAFEGEGCAICKASASMMTGVIKGKSCDEAETLVTHFRAMIMGQLTPEEEQQNLGRLRVFSGVKDLPSRVKCAILPWHTLHAAMNSKTQVSTENEGEPREGEDA